MPIVDIYHISLHCVRNFGASSDLTLLGKSIPTCNGLQIENQFPDAYDEFVKRFTQLFDASYEHDGSFGLFLNGESISGQIGECSNHVAFLELHGCRQLKSFDEFHQLFDLDHTVVQIMEAGVFCRPNTYKEFLE